MRAHTRRRAPPFGYCMEEAIPRGAGTSFAREGQCVSAKGEWVCRLCAYMVAFKPRASQHSVLLLQSYVFFFLFFTCTHSLFFLLLALASYVTYFFPSFSFYRSVGGRHDVVASTLCMYIAHRPFALSFTHLAQVSSVGSFSCFLKKTGKNISVGAGSPSF